MSEAFSESIRLSARRVEHILMGSKFAFKTRTGSYIPTPSVRIIANPGRDAINGMLERG
jgi:hypothetical protein